MNWAAAVSLADLHHWCGDHLGSPVVSVVFEAGHLSRVVGVRLADGAEVVVKVRGADPRLNDCHRVHAHLWDAGYPCPQPLLAPTPFGEYVASVEALVPGGEVWPTEGYAPDLLANALAELVRLAPRPEGYSSLLVSPPWAAWDHDAPELWPVADDTEADLNGTTEPAWIDEAARRVRERLAGSRSLPVIGHGDFYYDNIRWSGSSILAVHDWDSVILQPEPAVAGLGGAVCGRWASATIEENEAFLHTYIDAAGATWSRDDWEIAWAAGLWLRAFDARKQSIDGRPLTLQPAEARERLRRASA